jgi:hypothetical protein
MRFTFAAIAATTAVLATLFAAPAAQARMAAPVVAVPNHVDQVACRVVKDRVVRPGGRVVVTTRRVCGPGVGPVVVAPRAVFGCRTVKERIVRPNGTVVVRTARRC